MTDLGANIRDFIVAFVYAIVGMVVLFAGYKVFDLVTPTDMQKAIFQDRNLAVAVVVSAFILGVAIIIGAAIVG